MQFVTTIFAMIFAQVVITATMWMVVRCNEILPVYLTGLACLILAVKTVAAVVIFPFVGDISKTSQKFVLYIRAMYHTFNRNKRKFYHYLKSKSQRLLPIRFGVEFTLNQYSVKNYYDVVLTGIINVVLLIKP